MKEFYRYCSDFSSELLLQFVYVVAYYFPIEQTKNFLQNHFLNQYIDFYL